MFIVRWMRPAANDLKRINKRIAVDSVASADKLLHPIAAKADALPLYPAMGRPGRLTGTRELLVHQHYYIAYRTTGPTVQILRVKHTAQQWP